MLNLFNVQTVPNPTLLEVHGLNSRGITVVRWLNTCKCAEGHACFWKQSPQNTTHTKFDNIDIFSMCILHTNKSQRVGSAGPMLQNMLHCNGEGVVNKNSRSAHFFRKFKKRLRGRLYTRKVLKMILA